MRHFGSSVVRTVSVAVVLAIGVAGAGAQQAPAERGSAAAPDPIVGTWQGMDSGTVYATVGVFAAAKGFGHAFVGSALWPNRYYQCGNGDDADVWAFDPDPKAAHLYKGTAKELGQGCGDVSDSSHYWILESSTRLSFCPGFLNPGGCDTYYRVGSPPSPPASPTPPSRPSGGFPTPSPPQSAMSQGEKDSLRASTRHAWGTMLLTCGAIGGGGIATGIFAPELIPAFIKWGGTICGLAFLNWAGGRVQVNDPPDTLYGKLALPRPLPQAADTSFLCQATTDTAACPQLRQAVQSYQASEARVASLNEALGITVDRFQTAKAAGDARGESLQAAAARVYSGLITSAEQARQAAGAVLSAALRDASIRLRIPTARAKQALSNIKSLPQAVLQRLQADGLSAKEISDMLAAAQRETGLPATLDYSQLVQQPVSTAGFGAVYRAIRPVDVALIVEAFQGQGALSKTQAARLTAILKQADAAKGGARAAAMQSFLTAARAALGSSAYGSFLAAAAAPLTGGGTPGGTTTRPKPTTTSPTGSGGSTGTGQQALDAVMAILKQNAGPCGLTSSRITATGRTGNWTVVATVTGARSGEATWTVTNNTPTATNTLARTIAAGCPTP